METTLDVRGVTRRYGTREVLKGITFAAQKGEIIALLGRNGSYWLAVVAERADAHNVSTVWPCDYFLAYGYLIVFGCERGRYG